MKAIAKIAQSNKEAKMLTPRAIDPMSAARHTPVPTPAKAIVHAGQQIPVLAQLDMQALAAVRSRIDQLKARSFLDLVPMQYRQAVADLARSNFSAKGQGRTLTQFTEDMALNWLAKREAFDRIVSETGFKVQARVPVTYNGELLALSVNGSIVAMTGSSDGAARGIYYQRIALREDTSIVPFSTGVLMGSPVIDERLSTTVFRSSPLIGLATKNDPDQAQLSRSVIMMTRTFDGIDGHTIWRPRK